MPLFSTLCNVSIATVPATCFMNTLRIYEKNTYWTVSSLSFMGRSINYWTRTSSLLVNKPQFLLKFWSNRVFRIYHNTINNLKLNVIHYSQNWLSLLLQALASVKPWTYTIFFIHFSCATHPSGLTLILLLLFSEDKFSCHHLSTLGYWFNVLIINLLRYFAEFTVVQHLQESCIWW